MQNLETIPSKRKALIGRNNSRIFLTGGVRKDELLDTIGDIFERGERIRDFLALPHNATKPAIGIIGFEIAESIIKRTKNLPVRPSVFDAEFFELFKTRSNADKINISEIGYTCDLDKIRKSMLIDDGGSELVTTSLEINKDKLKITCIGIVKSLIPENAIECISKDITNTRDIEKELDSILPC